MRLFLSYMLKEILSDLLFFKMLENYICFLSYHRALYSPHIFNDYSDFISCEVTIRIVCPIGLMLTFFPRWESPYLLFHGIDLAVSSMKADWRKGAVRALSQTLYRSSFNLHVHRMTFHIYTTFYREGSNF